MSSKERGYNEFRVRISKTHPALFGGYILCDNCNKDIETEMVNITYYENMDGAIETQRAVCDDCFKKYEYYQDLDETTPEQFNEAFNRRPEYPNVNNRHCLNCGYKLDFDRDSMAYRTTCQKCNWRNKIGVNYNEPEHPIYEPITLRRKNLKDGFIQIAYPHIPKRQFNALTTDLQNALMHYFKEPETLRMKEYNLIESFFIKPTYKEIQKKIDYWRAIKRCNINLKQDEKFQVMRHQINHRDKEKKDKTEKLRKFANRENMEWKDLKRFILRFVKDLNFPVNLRDYFEGYPISKLQTEGFLKAKRRRRKENFKYSITSKGKKELKRLEEEKQENGRD